MSRVTIFKSLLVATVLAVVPVLTAEAQPTSFELLPGVVIDRGNHRVYSMKPGGGLEAIDGLTGRVLFESALADKPIALWDGVLAAQREGKSTPGRLEVALIDTGRPDQVRTIEVALPEGEFALVDDGLDRKFSIRSVGREGEFLIAWNTTRQWRSPLPPGANQKLQEGQQGAVRLDPATGQATALDPAHLEVDEPLPETARAFGAEPNLFGKPIRSGALIASTQTIVAGDKASQVVLKRWSADGLALPDIVLFRGEPIVQWPSADGRHLVISQRVAPGERDEYLWNVYSLETERGPGNFGTIFRGHTSMSTGRV